MFNAGLINESGLQSYLKDATARTGDLIEEMVESRVSAAKTILEIGIKATELEMLEERVDE